MAVVILTCMVYHNRVGVVRMSRPSRPFRRCTHMTPPQVTQNPAKCRCRPIRPCCPWRPSCSVAASRRGRGGRDPRDFPALLPVLGADYVALAAPSAGRWSVVADSGLAKPLPVELLAEALDREAARADADWMPRRWRPVRKRPKCWRFTCAHRPRPHPSPKGRTGGNPWECVSLSLSRAFNAYGGGTACAGSSPWRGAVGLRGAADRRLRRLEAMLEIANQWNQTREVEPLLVQMAEAATRLLGADRASIFLWDRPNHTLVGRPALGIPDGELRIPDDRGVVGEVIRTGQPRRVDAATEPAAVDRHVDAQLRYQTRTLAVRAAAGPLRRAVRGIRADQQAVGHVSRRKTKRPWSSWPPTRPWPWKTPKTASNCLRPTAKSPRKRRTRCG